MVVLLLDIVGSFFLSRLLVSRWVLVPLAVLLGLVNGYVASASLGMILWPLQSDEARVSSMVSAAVFHPIVCIGFTLWFRYRADRPRRP